MCVRPLFVSPVAINRWWPLCCYLAFHVNSPPIGKLILDDRRPPVE